MAANRIPNTVKPFKVSFENAQLDDLITDEKTITINLPAGTSSRTRMETLYKEYLKHLKDCGFRPQ